MLVHSTLDFASIDISFVNSKPGLKAPFKGRANILLLSLFKTYEIYNITAFTSQITSYLICLACFFLLLLFLLLSGFSFTNINNSQDNRGSGRNLFNSSLPFPLA